MAQEKLYGGIEAGGTKYVCAIGSATGTIESQTRIETTTPESTLQRVVQFFLPYTQAGLIKSIGVGCFGPVDLDPKSPSFGFITSTPKPGWQNTDVVGTLKRALGIQVAFDTDVNAAAFGEFSLGASHGFDPSLYLTIGTGIGGGFIKDGKPMNGLLHPEMGHIRIPHDRKSDPYGGSCPFHGDCFEGLASGPAIEKRLSSRGENLSPDDPFWELEVMYIANAIENYICILSPKIIVLGGGIMQRGNLLPMVRRKVQESLNGYLKSPSLSDNIDSYIVAPDLGNRSGVIGAIALAVQLESMTRGD